MSAGKDTKIFGGLGSFSLYDLIQLLGMRGRAATLVLQRHSREGKIYFKNGNVIHAFTGAIEGRDAFAELLTWEDANFVIEDGIPTLSKVTISESAVGLMLSTLAQLDEDSRETPAAGTPLPRTASEGPPVEPQTSDRVRPRVRRPVTGAVITVPEKAVSRFPVLPIAAVALLLTVIGVTWWILDRRPDEPVAAAVKSTPRAAPTTPPTTEPAEPTDSAVRADPPVAEVPVAAPDPAPTPAPFGVLTAEVASGVELRIDGRPVSAGTRQLVPGRHTLEVIRAGVLGVQRETVTIEPGQTLHRAYAADEYGWLQVVVIPWAEAFVGGQSIGHTPMGKVKAAVGEHRLALRHPEVEEQRQTVAVVKGETTLVRVTLPGVSE